MELTAMFKITDNMGREAEERMGFEWTKEDGIPSEEIILERAEEYFSTNCNCFNENCIHCECEPMFENGKVELVSVLLKTEDVIIKTPTTTKR